jgi:hypothetical protein
VRGSAVLLGIVVTVAGSAWAAQQRMTVDQLLDGVNARVAAHSNDDELARFLSGVELTERLTRHTGDELIAQDKLGPKAAEALELLRDASGLLDLPNEEMPKRAAPDAAEQQAILNAAVHYVAVTFKGLPNFLATRLTRSFDDTPLVITHSGWAPSNMQLHLAGTFDQEVTYRDGREAALHAVTTSGKDTRQGVAPPGLTSTGEFGPILAIVLRDASKGKIVWSHWEAADKGMVAVFSYEVPAATSHYEVNFCCVRGTEDPNAYGGGGPGVTGSGPIDSGNAYRGTPAYRGTLAIDEETGTILRITVDPQLKTDGPIARSAMEVEYGPVDIGGQTYTCPVRSVAISQSKTRLGGDMGDRTILRINEVTFTGYHRFGSSVRVVGVESTN